MRLPPATHPSASRCGVRALAFSHLRNVTSHEQHGVTATDALELRQLTGDGPLGRASDHGLPGQRRSRSSIERKLIAVDQVQSKPRPATTRVTRVPQTHSRGRFRSSAADDRRDEQQASVGARLEPAPLLHPRHMLQRGSMRSSVSPRTTRSRLPSAPNSRPLSRDERVCPRSRYVRDFPSKPLKSPGAAAAAIALWAVAGPSSSSRSARRSPTAGRARRARSRGGSGCLPARRARARAVSASQRAPPHYGPRPQTTRATQYAAAMRAAHPLVRVPRTSQATGRSDDPRQARRRSRPRASRRPRGGAAAHSAR